MTTSGPYDSNNPNPYEPMPSAPPVDPREHPGAPARPKSVETAFMLWVINSALSLLGLVVTLLFDRDALRAAARTSLEGSGTSFTEAQLDQAVNASLIFTGVVAVLFFALYLLFAFKMRAGRNWARIVLTVLGGLSIVLNLVSLGTTSGISMVLTLASLALVGGAVFLMFQRDSNEYFNAAKRAAH